MRLLIPTLVTAQLAAADASDWRRPAEIHVVLAWTSDEVANDDHDLRKVDKENKRYTYPNRYAKHGDCGFELDIRVYEDDLWYEDEMATWYGKRIPITLEDPDEVKITVSRSSNDG